MTDQKESARRVALGGVLAALALATVFLAGIVPGAELTLFGLASLYVSLFLAEAGWVAGLIFYFATSMLAFLIVPAKLALIPYALFFGLYPLIKHLIEKLSRPWLRYAAKLAVFNAIWAVGYWLFKNLVFGSVKLPDYPFWVLLLGSQLLFLLYDAILTRLVIYLRRRLRRPGSTI